MEKRVVRGAISGFILIVKRSARRLSVDRKRLIVYVTVLTIAIPLIVLTERGIIDNQFFSYTQVYYDEIGNPLDPKEKLFIEVKLRSTTFSANTPMPAEVFLFLNQNDRNGLDWKTNASETYRVFFENSICGGSESGELPSRCTVTLTRPSTDTPIYYATTTLTYSHGGEFDVRLDGIGNSTQQMVGHGFISIAPTEALHEYRTFKMSFVIGIIAAAFAALSLYEQARKDRS